jgi:MFS family permease
LGLVGGFMTVLDVNIVSFALPNIRSSLGASVGDLQWVLSVCAPVLGSVLVPAGRLGDVHGRRMMFMLGLALCYFGRFTALFFIFTLFLQNGLGRGALIEGVAITPFAAGSACAAAIGGRVVERANRTLVACGIAGVAVGLGGTRLARGCRMNPGGHRRVLSRTLADSPRAASRWRARDLRWDIRYTRSPQTSHDETRLP